MLSCLFHRFQETGKYLEIVFDNMQAMPYTVSMKTIMVRNVPDDLRKGLRLIALQRDISMNALLLEMIKDKVQGQGKGGIDE